MRSTLTLLNIDREFTGSLLFHLSRLGKDSVNSSVVNIKIPALQQSKVSILETPAGFSITPNPCSYKITVTFDKSVEEPLTFEIYDMLGQRVMEEKVVSDANASRFTISLPSLPDGSYILVCNDQRRKFVERFVVVQR